MSDFLGDVAGAALPVAIVLLVLAAAARAVLWAQVDDPQAQRLAQQYLEPLSSWCLIALGVYALALGGAGRAGVLSLGPALALAAAAVLLRTDASTPDVGRSPAPETLRPETGGRSASPESVHGRTPPSTAPEPSLWNEPEDSGPRTGLWSR